MNIGLLHPGAMGVTVGVALAESGHQVHWCSEGRGAATLRRAASAGFGDRQTLPNLVRAVDGIICVCPPEAALEVAANVERSGFSGLYVDANAVSPDTGARLAALLGESYVDGGIVGPPARSPDSTRLFLSGPHAAEAAGWFSAGFMETVVLGERAGAAKALKMCYAAYTKGASALLLAIRALAEVEGVTDALLAEWSRSQPGLAERSERAAQAVSPKAWRFSGEMLEIAATFGAAGLPGGFHGAAADVYQRMADLKNADHAQIADVIERLLSERPSDG
ncbi:MAG: DUF1932 domain-containing protein [Gammaproteobacteria bacterium]|nr:DUF1932 domain-containing protein [Gammaproteobacteria bacterium]